MPLTRKRAEVAGVLILIVGVMCFLGTWAGIAGGTELIPIGYPEDFPALGFVWELTAWLLSVPLGFAAITAGTFAMSRQHWDVAFFGSILGAAGGILVFWVFGGIIGIAAVVLVGMSRNEFKTK